MGKIIGIDLGTSNSAAAVLQGGKATIIPSAEGNSPYGKSFPSYVAFTKDGQVLVGEPARRQATMNPEGTLTGFKRKMGTSYKYKVRGKDYRPEELSAMILKKIKNDAEAFLSDKVEKAVITVPAYFNDNQRQATKDAAKIAGLNVARLVNEPTAACLAYGVDKKGQEMKILVFDFGGGTLDVTIMDFGEGVFEVKSTSGDTQLGGKDMDEVLIQFLVDEFRKQTGVDISKDIQAMRRFREAGERAKIELSSVLNTEINLPFLSMNKDKQPLHFQYTLTRAKLDELVRPIVERCKGPIDRALKDAKMTPQSVDKIILVGGPTRMPIVQKFVEDYIGKKAERGVDPMECVAVGAAIQAGIITGEVKDILLLDVTPLSLGIETAGSVMTVLIARNTTIPTKKTQIFTTAADFQTAVDIHILQGERPLAKDNISLGRFTLTDIPPAQRGIPKIEVTYDIDANGILHVSAKDTASGKEKKIDVIAPNRMSDEEIKKKVGEAEKYADEDKKRLELVKAKNDAESMIYTSEKMFKEYKEKIPADIKKKIDDTKKDLEETMKSKDAKKIQEKVDALKQAMEAAGGYMYQHTNKDGKSAPNGSGPNPNGTKGPNMGAKKDTMQGEDKFADDENTADKKNDDTKKDDENKKDDKGKK